MMLHVYGIPNCDTVRKSVKFFDANKIAYTFHDIRLEGLTAEKVNYWIKKAGLEELVNKKSTTWRALGPAAQVKAGKADTAVLVLIDNSTIIKRPVVEAGKNVTAGFNEELFKKYSKK
jgi:arsenate reductase